MNVPSFLKEHDIVLIIGSGHVSGAVVEFGKSQKPKILFTHESHFPVKVEMDASNLTTHMLSATQHCVGALHKKYTRKIKRVQVVLASPWFSSFSKNISIKKPQAFLVNQKTVDSLVSEYFESLSKKQISDKNFLVEQSVSHIRLNGYETANPFGQMAESLDISVYASLAPVVTREKIESEIYTLIHPQKVIFHTFPFVAWNVLNMLFAPKEDVVFVDIGSETTDLLVVRRGSIEKSASLPIGINQLHRKVGVGYDTYPELAHGFVSLYAADLLEPETEGKIRTLVDAFGEEWGVQFFQVFDQKDKEHGHFLPQKAFFISDKYVHGVFNDVIKKQIPDTLTLNRNNISQFAEYGDISQPNTFLVLAAVYASRAM